MDQPITPETVRAERARRGLSLEKFARLVGARERQTVWRWEAGEARPTGLYADRLRSLVAEAVGPRPAAGAGASASDLAALIAEHGYALIGRVVAHPALALKYGLAEGWDLVPWRVEAAKNGCLFTRYPVVDADDPHDAERVRLTRARDWHRASVRARLESAERDEGNVPLAKDDVDARHYAAMAAWYRREAERSTAALAAAEAVLAKLPPAPPRGPAEAVLVVYAQDTPENRAVWDPVARDAAFPVTLVLSDEEVPF